MTLEHSDEHLLLNVEYTSDMRLVVRHPQGREPIGQVEIPQGASVFWKFSGLPRDLVRFWAPSIRFTNDSPFAVLKASHEGVWGLDNLGEAGSFTFQAAWSDWRMPRLSCLVSHTVLLWQKALTVDVEIDLEAKTFTVNPKYCRITPGTPVLWRFPNLDPDYQAEIRFGFQTNNVQKKGLSLNSNYFGPFASMSRTPEGLLGEGISSHPGQYMYIVEVSRERETRWGVQLQSALSEDPVIDNEEDPLVGGEGPEDSGGP